MKKTKVIKSKNNVFNLSRYDLKIPVGDPKRAYIYSIFLSTLLLLVSLPLVIVQPAEAPFATWVPELVDESTDAGEYNSLAFDSLGIPHIAYRRSEPFPTAVLHAWKIGGIWYNETVFWDAGVVGRWPSIAIGSDDVLHISFFANDELYYTTNASGTWPLIPTVVDSDPFAIVGWYSSITLDSTNNPRIAYYDKSNEDLKYAYYDSSWHTEVVDGNSKDDSGQYCSLALAPDNTPHISYYYWDDANIGMLKHAWKVGNSWNDEIVTDVGFPGRYSSIAVDDTGGIHISHYRLIGKDLLYSNNSGSGWTTVALETTGEIGFYTSLALDGSNQPHIAHFDNTNSQIKRTWREGGSWYTETVISSGTLPHDRTISIAMSPDNQTKISYYDANNCSQMYASGIVNFIDLAVEEVWLNPSAPFDNGDTVQIYANITNKGTMDSGSFIVRFYDRDPTFGGIQIGLDQNVPSLSSGNYSVVSVPWTATPIGIHYIYVEVNPDEAILDPFQDNDKNHTIVEVLGPEINLEPGWNLISLPLIQENVSLTAVLDSISDDYDAVYCYNLTDFSDYWKLYHTSKPYDMIDLDELNQKIGFWIHITNPSGTTLRINGSQPSENQSIILHPGWNLVGYPSLVNNNRTAALNNIVFDSEVSSIWTYNATTHKWEEIIESDYFEVGRGYWIYSISSTDVIWEVPV